MKKREREDFSERERERKLDASGWKKGLRVIHFGMKDG